MAFGAGCAGTAGTPQLEAGGTLPWLAGSLSVNVGGLASSVLAGALCLETSSRLAFGLPLPLDLSQEGMTGCSLLTSCDATVALAFTAGGTAWAAPVCTCHSALGADLFLQAAAFDLGANPAGVVWSNGLTATIGER